MDNTNKNQLIVWIKDGNYRIKILKVLRKEKLLSGEIAERINNHRSTTSRILKNLITKGLITCVKSNSRTRLYTITTKGRLLSDELTGNQ